MNTLRVSLLAMALGVGALAQAQAPDNTKQNSLDSTNRQDTADHSGNDQADLKLAQQIRKSIVADKSLSTYAHNIKIVAKDGNVTLNGVVRSEDEKKVVEAKAQSASATGSITSNLKVAP